MNVHKKIRQGNNQKITQSLSEKNNYEEEKHLYYQTDNLRRTKIAIQTHTHTHNHLYSQRPRLIVRKLRKFILDFQQINLTPTLVYFLRHLPA